MIHPADCQCDTYGCQLRRKGLQVSPAAMPNRHNRVVKQTQPNAHNAQIRGERRPGGFISPYLHASTGAPVRAKEYEAKHHAIHDTIARSRAELAKRGNQP